jgi:hypothetical protein
VLAWGYVAQGVGLGVTATAIGVGADPLIVYAGAIFASTALTITRPVQAVIVPSLARSPDELTATNVVCSWVESASAVIGSALTGVLLAVSGADVVFALFAVTSVLAALLVFGVPGPAPAPADETEGGLAVALGGFAAVREHPYLRPLVGLLLLDAVLLGALDVLFVVLAIDVLGLGDGWVGYLNATFSAGGIVGGAVAVTLVGRRHLARPITVGVCVCAAAFVVIAIWPSATVAVLLLAASGTGRVLLDVGGRTLLQRTTPTEVLGRVFGVLEGLQMVGLALGTALIPPLVALGGAETALVGTGLVLAVALALAARPLVRVDRGAQVPVVEISLLRSMALFEALPPPALEGLARALEPLELAAGTVVIREGDAGDRFYAVAAGEVEVWRQGRCVARLGRGEGFGEIALLEEIPRTADVTAVTDVRLYALGKEEFVTAVAGYPPAAQVADALVMHVREDLARQAAG